MVMTLNDLFMCWNDWEIETHVVLWSEGMDYIAEGRAYELLAEYGDDMVYTFGRDLDAGEFTLFVLLK